MEGGPSPRRRGQADAALGQPLEGANLVPPVGSPAARNARIFTLALALGEKTHRSTMVPPLPIAIGSQQTRLFRRVEVLRPLLRGAHHHRIEFTKSRRRLIASSSYQYLDEPRLSGDSPPAPILDELEYIPLY